VINKRRGVTIHPGSGAHSGTLVNALLAHCSDLSGIRGVERPGIVHRLDKDTSGLIVVAKEDRAHVGLSVQFAERSILKIYQALVHGVPPARGVVEQPIARHRVHRQRMAIRPNGRSARTDYEVLEAFGQDYALLELHLHTGRTHQIRVHMTWLGHPLVGDPVYGRRPNPWELRGQALHCRRLGFFHPVLNRPMEFEAPLPEVLARILEDLRGGMDPLPDDPLR
jgi:23S rRNA pseudouridine1911/1915/1917 synthase